MSELRRRPQSQGDRDPCAPTGDALECAEAIPRELAALAAPQEEPQGAPQDDEQPLAAAEPAAHWRAILSGASPREVLARLVNGDPLRLRGHVGAALRERAYLLDADRAFLRAAARCARFAGRYRGQPELERWLRERVDEALLDLTREELEAARAPRPPRPEELEAFTALARPLGLDPAAVRAACAAFNDLPQTERSAFRALVLERMSLDDVARAPLDGERLSATEAARRARRALETVLAAAGRSCSSRT